MEQPLPLVVILIFQKGYSVKLHGLWKSDTAKDMYILEDVSKLLKVTSQLGL